MIPKVLKPEELDKYWPAIKGGLEDILRKDPEQDWCISGVYKALKIEDSYCILGIDEDVKGFFIGHILKDNSFFAWIGWGKNIVGEGMAMAEAFARLMGCTAIKFATGRAGWDAVARKYGYKPTVWVKKL